MLNNQATPQLISIDTGKFATKAVTLLNGEIKRSYIRTKLIPTTEFELNDENSHLVSYLGQSYIVGKDAEDSAFLYDTDKQSMEHLLFIYMQAALLRGGNTHVKLCVNTPMSTFLNPKKREEHRRSILGLSSEETIRPKTVTISIDDVQHEFVIADVIMYPENAGIIYKNADIYADKVVNVVDIGGLNINGGVYVQLGRPSKTFTVRNGGLILYSDLRDELETHYPDMDLTEFELEQIVKNKCIKNSPLEAESFEIVDNFLRDWAQQNIEKEMKRRKWNLYTAEQVFVGGTSLLLKDYIKEIFPNANISNNVFDNAEGYLIMEADDQIAVMNALIKEQK